MHREKEGARERLWPESSIVPSGCEHSRQMKPTLKHSELPSVCSLSRSVFLHRLHLSPGSLLSRSQFLSVPFPCFHLFYFFLPTLLLWLGAKRVNDIKAVHLLVIEHVKMKVYYNHIFTVKQLDLNKIWDAWGRKSLILDPNEMT